ncbi:MAG: T9SS type A sorting domain-containing protein, partial [Bacteroidia bacterium]
VTTWAGPSSYTATGSAITVASPSVATTYTCTINMVGTCGCANVTQTITINPVACSGSAPTYTPATNYTLSTSGRAQQDIYVNGISYTIKGVELKMDPGTNIVVSPTGTLVVLGSWLHACSACSPGGMWQGITVQNGGTLRIIVGGTRSAPLYNTIEDAVKAVYTYSSTTSTPIPNWSISDVIFNNNTDDIYIDAHLGDLSANTIWNCIFTCRNLGNHSLTGSNFIAVRNDIKASTPTFTSSANPTDLTIAGARTSHGIYIKAVNGGVNPVKIGSGSNGVNLFDNLDYGIYSTDAYVDSKNCRFQNMTGNHYNALPIGIGIYATLSNNHAKLIAGNSNLTINNTERDTFLNCLIGIGTYRMNDVHINNDYFNNETTASTFTVNNSYVTGEYGVDQVSYAHYSSTVTPEQMEYGNNTCKNYATGHALDFEKLYNTGSASTTFTNNVITGTGTSTLYCKTGIYLQQSGANIGANTGVPIDAVSVTTNSITNVTSNCISASAINTATASTGFITISANTELSVKYSTVGTATLSPPIAGVYLSGCNRVKVSNNPLITCTGFGTSSYLSTYAHYLQGVYVTQSPNSRVTCNAVSELGEDFVWYGTNTNSIWKENTMNRSQYGLVLRSTGIMGDQGSASNPIYNVWGKQVNTDISIAQTLTDASNPGVGSSKLFCLASTCSSSVTPLPCTNFTVAGSGATPYGASTLSVTTGSSPGLCTSEGGTGRMTNNANVQDASADSSSLVALLNFTDSLPAYTHETYWATQYYVSSANNSINAVQDYENAKGFALVDGAMTSGDYSTAQNLLNAITTKNAVENNWKTVDGILIAQGLNNNDSLNTNDISSLTSVAQQCPMSGGSIVWKARALINKYYMTVINYSGDCPDLSGNNGERKSNGISSHVIANPTFNLYPNPNNGNLFLDYIIGKDANLEIVDINGNLVGTYNLPTTRTRVEVRNENLQNGVYLYRIISNNNMIKFGKIVVMK